MANKASAKKENRKNIKRNRQNSSARSRVSTFLKKAELAVLNASSYNEADDAVRRYVSVAMKVAKTNAISKSAVARKNSRLILRLRKRLGAASS